MGGSQIKLILLAAWAALVINYCIGFLWPNFPLTEVSQCFFLIWLISACMCLFVWTWGGTGCLMLSHKVCFFNKGPSPRTRGNHLESSVTGRLISAFRVTRGTSKIFFEMRGSWNTWALSAWFTHLTFMDVIWADSGFSLGFCSFPACYHVKVHLCLWKSKQKTWHWLLWKWVLKKDRYHIPLILKQRYFHFHSTWNWLPQPPKCT